MSTSVEMSMLRALADLQGVKGNSWTGIVREALERSSTSSTSTVEWIEMILEERKPKVDKRTPLVKIRLKSTLPGYAQKVSTLQDFIKTQDFKGV